MADFWLDVPVHRLPNVPMPFLGPQTLTRAEQEALLRATSVHLSAAVLEVPGTTE
jgi:hypothetical protein